jgi:hypothetical protein
MTVQEITIAYRTRVLEIMRTKYERLKGLKAVNGTSEDELEDAELKMLEAQFGLDKATAGDKRTTGAPKTPRGR